MSKFERFVARWLILRLLRWPQGPRLRDFFSLMRSMTWDEFPEDSEPSIQSFLTDTLRESYEEQDK